METMYKTLITGTDSGLGKYLSINFQDPVCITRRYTIDALLEDADFVGVEMIIHCAVNSAFLDINSVTYQYLYDNILLTQRLTEIRHNKFIYISSLDVNKMTMYGVAKKFSELLVEKNCDNYLILRPSSMLGKEMRQNTFSKICSGEPINLTSDSVFNFVSYNDVLSEIKRNSTGIREIYSSENITLRDLSTLLDTDIAFGNVKYTIGEPTLGRDTGVSSAEVILQFIKEIK